MTNLIDCIKLTNEFTKCAIEIEKNGIAVDVAELDKLEKECDETIKINYKLCIELAEEAFGDEPFNLNSPRDRSKLLFSREIKDYKLWKETFELGSEARGFVKKKRYPRRFTSTKFKRIYEYLTRRTFKKLATTCSECVGGYIFPRRKDGTIGKARRKCTQCGGMGYSYTETEELAGFGLTPWTSKIVSANGFSTDKELTMEPLLRTLPDGKAKEFIKAYLAYSKAEKNKTTYIGGIRRAIGRDGILHFNLMQTVTATGRLSSTNPNLHNQPRGDTFPIRRVFVSRWEGGKIVKADYAQLEFRVAASLSKDKDALDHIKDGVDAHAFTASMLTDGGQHTDRQEAKAHTFKPLYGGTSGTDAEKNYYTHFIQDRYPGIGAWHDELLERAVTYKHIDIPSGRRYAFPDTKRWSNGGVSGATQIKNYPVQGFATADIVPLATIYVLRAFTLCGLRSLLINEVHDEIVIDTYPGEEEQIADILYEEMTGVKERVKEWWDYDLLCDLDVEVSVGNNWLDVEQVR